MIGGMGHTAMTALGVALYDKKDVICLDGDGSFLMHMGGVATAVNYSKKNLKYILLIITLRSVGIQPTIYTSLNFRNISKDFGFKKFISLTNKRNYKKKLKKYIKIKGNVFIHIKVNVGSLKNLERPKSTYEIKNKFMS